MEIYQGEPLGARITAKDDIGYRQDISDTHFEALLKDTFGKEICRWSSEAGTITYGTYEKDGQTIGYAGFGLNGEKRLEYVQGLTLWRLRRLLAKAVQ